MIRKMALTMLGAAALICAVPELALGRNDGPGTLIETRPYESDEHITATIRDMIAKDKHLKKQPIKVSTSHAIVTLSGSVDSQQNSNRITAMVKRMPEVDKVRNRLKIEHR